MPHRQHIDSQIRNCIDLCNQCRDICEIALLQNCDTQEKGTFNPDNIKLLMDCMEACSTAAHFMLRGSEYHVLYCEACAKVSESCSKACLTSGDDLIKNCGYICKKCAEICKKIGNILPEDYFEVAFQDQKTG